MLQLAASTGLLQDPNTTQGEPVTARKQLSMVLPTELINAIKLRAQQRGQSITAYISALARADLDQPAASAPPLHKRVQNLEDRLQRLEQQLSSDSDSDSDSDRVV